MCAWMSSNAWRDHYKQPYASHGHLYRVYRPSTSSSFEDTSTPAGGSTLHSASIQGVVNNYAFNHLHQEHSQGWLSTSELGLSRVPAWPDLSATHRQHVRRWPGSVGEQEYEHIIEHAPGFQEHAVEMARLSNLHGIPSAIDSYYLSPNRNTLPSFPMNEVVRSVPLDLSFPAYPTVPDQMASLGAIPSSTDEYPSSVHLHSQPPCSQSSSSGSSSGDVYDQDYDEVFDSATGQYDSRLNTKPCKRHPCSYPHCKKSFTRRGDAERHYKQVHEGRKFQCKRCGKKVQRREQIKRHMETCLAQQFMDVGAS